MKDSQRLTSFLVVFALLLVMHFTVEAASGIFQTYVVYDLNGGGNTFRAGGINSDGATTYDGTNLGIATSLTLNGGEVKTFKNGISDVFSARINYRIYPTSGSPGGFTTINLPFDSNLPNPGDQKWKQEFAGVDVLSGLSPGTYFLEVYWDVSSSDGTHFDTNFGNNHKATFTVAQAEMFQTYIIYDLNSGGNTFNAGGANADGATAFDGQSFGTPTSLALKGGEIKTFKNNGGDVTAAKLYYRVYEQSGTPGSFIEVNLPFDSNIGGSPGEEDQKWQEAGLTTDLLSGLANGDYYLEAFWKIETNLGDR